MQLTYISSSDFFQNVLDVSLFQREDKQSSMWRDFEKNDVF